MHLSQLSWQLRQIEICSTQELAQSDGWGLDDADERLVELANLALGAWPSH